MPLTTLRLVTFKGMIGSKLPKRIWLQFVHFRVAKDKIVAEFGSSHPDHCLRLEYLFFAQDDFRV